MPEAFNADGADVFVGVGDDSVGWVAPCPSAVVTDFLGVVFAAGVDDEGGWVVHFGAHADGGEVAHADDLAQVLFSCSVGRA